MHFSSVKLKGFLSFGENPAPIPLRALNIVIGPNGSGKSNLIEAIELIANTPNDFEKSIREGGGVREWLWKGAGKGKGMPAAIEFTLADTAFGQDLRYHLAFIESGQRLEIVDEFLEDEHPKPGTDNPDFYYRYQDGRPVLNVASAGFQNPRVVRKLKREEIDLQSSILKQRKDPEAYPEITALGEFFAKEVRIYKDWTFGRFSPPRLPQKTDQPNHRLASDCSNLGLVLNGIRRFPKEKADILKALKALFEGIEDYDVIIEGGTAQVFLTENGMSIPATRLSDGTLRFLCLLAILCHPNPSKVVCIEEPELGLHPDMIVTLAELLKSASERCQLIVTTHSEMLVDAFSESPENILVCERTELGTEIKRLDENELRSWLEDYTLGQLWMKGKLGGTRW